MKPVHRKATYRRQVQNLLGQDSFLSKKEKDNIETYRKKGVAVELMAEMILGFRAGAKITE